MSWKNNNNHGLIQKEKVDIDDEKGAQISIVAKHFVTQVWSEIMIMKYKQAIHYFRFLFSYYVYIMLLIWSRNWNYVYWLLLFLIRSKYVHAQISVPKIGIPMSKRVCINPWKQRHTQNKYRKKDFFFVLKMVFCKKKKETFTCPGTTGNFYFKIEPWDLKAHLHDSTKLWWTRVGSLFSKKWTFEKKTYFWVKVLYLFLICYLANFEPFSRGQPFSTNINHQVFRSKVTRNLVTRLDP